MRYQIIRIKPIQIRDALDQANVFLKLMKV